MRVCHVITRLIVGGAQENTVLTCEGLAARGHDVLLLSGPDTGSEGSLWPRVEQGSYASRRIAHMHRAIRPLADWRSVGELARAYTEFAPDIIHTHSSKAGIVGRWAARRCPDARVVHTIHGMSFNVTQSWPIQRAYRGCERVVAPRTDRYVSVADAMTRQAVAAGLAPADRFVTVYSGMDTSWFTPDPATRAAARARLGVGEDDIVVGTVARLFHHKGYDHLIPAMARARRAGLPLRFVWVGDGPQRGHYFDQATRAGVADDLLLTGLITPREVGDAMQAFDLVVHCSEWEGLPRAVVQGLLLEKPVVSFDNDGAPEVVLDGATGRLVTSGDSAALADAIVDLARRPGDRATMGQRGRTLCRERFSASTMVDQLEHLYEQLLAQPRPQS